MDKLTLARWFFYAAALLSAACMLANAAHYLRVERARARDMTAREKRRRESERGGEPI